MLQIRFRPSWTLFLILITVQALFLSSSAPSALSASVAPQAPAWAPNTAYAVGAQVTYQGVLYQCRQAHTSLVTWEPPNTPALWLVVPGGGGGDTQAPSAPTNLRVTGVTASSVSLAWNASTDNVGVTRYDVSRDGAVVGGGSATSFTVTGLASETSFMFTVRARDAAGNVSALSNQVTATTQPGGGGVGGQIPKRVLVGYWHNFDNGSGFIRLRDVSRDFDVIDVAFGEPAPGSRSTIQFVPDVRTSAAEVQADIAQLKSEGKKVLLSLGGANGHVELPTETDRQNFINSISNLITQYGFNGIDIDLEGGSVTLNAGDTDFRNPTTGLPATPPAAGSGYTPPAEIAKAINYLVLGNSYGGRYVLRKPSGYPNFRGVMTWSINWDRFANFGFSRGIRPVLNGLP